MNTKEFWNKRFKFYGHTGWSDELIYKYDQSIRVRKISSLLRNVKLKTALDLGCGTGDFTKLLSSLGGKISVIGVDISDVTIESNRNKNKNEGVFFTAKGLLDYDITPNEFDIIICITVLQHITVKSELIQLLKSIRRGLTEGGSFIFLENVYNEDEIKSDSYINKSFSKKDWIDVCKESELSVESIQSYPQLGINLVEFIFLIFSKVKCKFKNRSLSISPGTREGIDRSNNMVRKIITIAILSVTYVFDKIFKIDTSVKSSNYLIFKCKK
jgi:SAM-dependent methyltransferase